MTNEQEAVLSQDIAVLYENGLSQLVIDRIRKAGINTLEDLVKIPTGQLHQLIKVSPCVTPQYLKESEKRLSIRGALRKLNLRLGMNSPEIDSDSIQHLQIPLADRERIMDALYWSGAEGIRTIPQLTQMTEAKLLRIDKLGAKSVRLIKEALTQRGLSLKSD